MKNWKKSLFKMMGKMSMFVAVYTVALGYPHCLIILHQPQVYVCFIQRSDLMKIAICDDEKPFLDKLYQILQEIRMELNIPISIIKFIDGKELLNYFEVHKDIDVFILDILMNPINGYDVARKIRKMDNKVKLVFLTSIKNYAIAGYNIRLEKYILIHTKDSSVKCYHCLKLLEDKLDTNFYRCHASFIVNLLHIDTYERLEIKLENNFHIPVSKHRKSGFTEKLLDFYARYME